MNTEPIYSSGNVMVSRTRLMIGSSTYAISAISSWQIVTIPPNKSALHWLSTFAVFFLFMGTILVLGSDAHLVGGSLLLLGTVLTAGAFINRKKMKPTFGLRITTTAQEHQVLTSPNLEALRPVESALHQALSMRG